MTDDQFKALCNTFGFAPSRALRELIDCAVGQAPKSILDINFKEPQPGMVNLDAFHAFHFNDPPKGGFVGEIEMLKWLVRNRDGDYWKAKHGGKA
jgi:hypothetical protein